jgi:HlyD family secretion protein
LTVAAATAGLLLWAALAKVDIVATAEGRLVPSSLVKVVQPAEGGVVSDLLVKEGDTVGQGQLLVRLDARATQAEWQGAEQELWAQLLGLASVEATLEGKLLPTSAALLGAAERQLAVLTLGQADTSKPEWRLALARQAHAQMQARHAAQAQAVLLETVAGARAQAELAAAGQVQQKLKRTLPHYQQSAEAYRSLVVEGFVGELAAQDKAREALERESDLKAQEATVSSLQAAVAQSASRQASLRADYRAKLENERAERQAAVGRGAPVLQKARLRGEMLELRAPQAGVVKDLAVHSPGAVLQAGSILLTLVPQGETLVAEVSLRNEDVGFVFTGQVARLKVAAFPFQKYGLWEATVTRVAADATTPQTQPLSGESAAQPSYRAIVTPSAAALAFDPHSGLLLQAGMRVTAEIHQGERSVLEYLLSPVRQVAQEAGRER